MIMALYLVPTHVWYDKLRNKKDLKSLKVEINWLPT